MKIKNLFNVFIFLIVTGGLCGTAMAAEKNIPQNHWSYKAIKLLEQDGIINGTENIGTESLSREKMAVLVENAMNNSSKATAKQKALIDKLAVEFALELNGITTDSSENTHKTNHGLHIGFDTLMTMSTDDPAGGKEKVRGNDMFHWRARLNLKGNLNEKTTYNARLTTSFGTAGMKASSTRNSTLSFDRVYFDTKDLFGFDNVLWGRQRLDVLGGNLAYKSGNNDGITFSKNLNPHTTLNLGALIVKPEPSTSGTFSGDSQDVQYISLTSKISPKLKLGGMFFNNNTSVAKTDTCYNYSYGGSKIGGISASYKMGKYTLLGEFDQAHLSNIDGVSKTPHAYALQLTNGTVSPEIFYPASQTVTNINKKGDNAFVLSYRFTEKGTVPNGLGPWSGATVTSPVSSLYTNSKSPNGVDNIKGFYFSYQYVLDKGVELSFDTQFLRYADTGKKFDNIYMLLLNTRF